MKLILGLRRGQSEQFMPFSLSSLIHCVSSPFQDGEFIPNWRARFYERVQVMQSTVPSFVCPIRQTPACIGDIGCSRKTTGSGIGPSGRHTSTCMQLPCCTTCCHDSKAEAAPRVYILGVGGQIYDRLRAFNAKLGPSARLVFECSCARKG